MRVNKMAYIPTGKDFEDFEANNQGIGGIGQDIAESIQGLPSYAANMAKQLPGEVWGALTHPSRIQGNLLAGLGEGAIGLLNTPGVALDYFANKGLIPKSVSKYAPHIGDLGVEKFLGIEPKEKGDMLIRSLSGLAVPGSILKAAKLGKAASPLATALYSMGQNENPLQAALLGEAVPIGKELYNRGRPSSIFRGELPPEELARKLQLTQGTETPLGDVIQSPFLKRLYENVLPHVLGSGAEKVMQRTGTNIQQLGVNLMNRIGSQLQVNPEDVGARIQHALRTTAREAEQQKEANFKRVNDSAEKLGVNTNRTQLREAAKNILKSINEDPDLANFTNTNDISLLEKISANPANDKGFSLRNTGILRGAIGKAAYEARTKGEMPKEAIYNKLKNALEEDVNQAIEQSGSSELQDLHNNAMDFYRNEYAQYKDPEIRKYIKGGGDPDLILQHFIKGGKNDRGTILQKLSNALRQNPEISPAVQDSSQLQHIGTSQHQTQRNPQETLLAYSYLSKALDDEGHINPVKLRTLYHNLGTNQKRALFGEGDLANEVRNYADLVGHNKEAFDLMLNPHTGKRNSALLSQVGQLATGAAFHHLPLLIASGIGGRLATNRITSPKYREKLINAMIKNKRVELPKTTKALQPLGAVATNEQKPLELELNQGARYGKY